MNCRRFTRLSVFLGLTTLAVLMVPVPLAVGALTPPKGGVIEVTGFNRVALFGNSSPVVTVVKGQKAAALRAALANLALKSTSSECQEMLVPFTVSFIPSTGARPRMVASAFDCAGLGVSVVAGHSTVNLADDCAFESAASAALPRAGVEATRRVVTINCPDSSTPRSTRGGADSPASPAALPVQVTSVTATLEPYNPQFLSHGIGAEQIDFTVSRVSGSFSCKIDILRSGRKVASETAKIGAPLNRSSSVTESVPVEGMKGGTFSGEPANAHVTCRPQ
jgi:hypothetical protein